jgi:hypothetical protein
VQEITAVITMGALEFKARHGLSYRDAAIVRATESAVR